MIFLVIIKEEFKIKDERREVAQFIYTDEVQGS